MASTPNQRRDLLATLAGLAVSVPVGVLYYRTTPHGLSREGSAFAEAVFAFLVAHWIVMLGLARRARDKTAHPSLIDVDVSESAVVMRSADETWALLHDPTFARVTDPSVVEAFRSPSTTPGLGEVQIFLSRDGSSLSVSAVEVIGYEEGRFARARPVSLHKWATEQWTDYRVEPLDAASCRVTVGEHLKFRVSYPRHARKLIDTEREKHLAACRHILEQLSASAGGTS